MVGELSECDEVRKADEVVVRAGVVETEVVEEVGTGKEERDDEVSRVFSAFSEEEVKGFDSERETEEDSALLFQSVRSPL